MTNMYQIRQSARKILENRAKENLPARYDLKVQAHIRNRLKNCSTFAMQCQEFSDWLSIMEFCQDAPQCVLAINKVLRESCYAEIAKEVLDRGGQELWDNLIFNIKKCLAYVELKPPFVYTPSSRSPLFKPKAECESHIDSSKSFIELVKSYF